jgi:hypothetical protein
MVRVRGKGDFSVDFGHSWALEQLRGDPSTLAKMLMKVTSVKNWLFTNVPEHWRKRYLFITGETTALSVKWASNYVL